MFRQLILRCSRGDGMKTEEMYEEARKLQPNDTVGPMCPHRKVPSDMEWQHELRREQQQLKREGLIERRNGRWRTR